MNVLLDIDVFLSVANLGDPERWIDRYPSNGFGRDEYFARDGQKASLKRSGTEGYGA
ncbi:MAG: hypothetical protein ACRERU_05065 [Methylococcales bacterium]